MQNFKANGLVGGGIAFTIIGDHDNRPTFGTNLIMEKKMTYGFDAGATRDVGIAWYEECSKTLANGSCPGHHNHILEEGEEGLEDIVRRLTPTECERLQGYPDNWTLIGKPKMIDVKDYKITYDEEMNVVSKELIGVHEEEVYVYTDDNGKEIKVTDSARYKALGNSIALPQWWWLICKMEKYLPQNPKLGSLFDGIGGFPLVFETKYGKGSARWASEIEPFPIAVTKARFPEGETE